jgi:molybdate transport system permease protein
MNSETLHSLALSLRVATVATMLVVAVGLALAFVLARARFRGRAVLDMLCTLPLVLPPTVTGYYLVLVLGRRGLLGKPLYEHFGITVMFTWEAATVASFIVALPLMIKAARAAIESVDETLINASYTMGYSKLSTTFRVILPLSMKGIAAGAVLSFARALGEFGATLMVAGNIPGRTDTMPIAIYTKASAGDWSEANLLVIFFTFMSAAILLGANRFLKSLA